MSSGWPPARPGQAVGLLGGSFDPAHQGHAHITREALKRFGLDHVWWLVSPGNPLKENAPAPLADRLTKARQVMDHPRVTVTDVEAKLGTRYTAQTLRGLIRRYPGVRFVWLMGADNLASLHHWQDWRDIMGMVPVGVLARPGDRISARRSVAAQLYDDARLVGPASQMLPQMEAPCWCYINLPLSEASSSAIRAKGDWRSS
ncbi:nicotinate-nucleotide adenylyltransferase [uncultured Litoreibacter sp.]|uniref:nicotinate-nucleotide adenylyltransferase n=1 Tax=uncultured Litoreibacter sp. TaxID=1392394 RepID=UPI0026147D7E|nr:nicotinate-nucleotide adenylyltransferase [uncultured Litoreibacter sp.]